jgi:hypothetical protein
VLRRRIKERIARRGSPHQNFTGFRLKVAILPTFTTIRVPLANIKVVCLAETRRLSYGGRGRGNFGKFEISLTHSPEIEKCDFSSAYSPHKNVLIHISAFTKVAQLGETSRMSPRTRRMKMAEHERRAVKNRGFRVFGNFGQKFRIFQPRRSIAHPKRREKAIIFC